MSILPYLRDKYRIRFNLPPKKDFRKAQCEAVDFACSQDTSTLQLPTGSGKSLVLRGIAYYSIYELGETPFIIVPSYDIGDTILGEIVFETTKLNPKFHAPERKPDLDKTTKLVITTYQSFWRRIAEYKRMFPKMRPLYDEAHHVNYLAPTNFNDALSFKKFDLISASPWSPFCTKITKQKYIYKMDNAILDNVISEPNIITTCPPESIPFDGQEIWYYDSIDEALKSFGKARRISGKGFKLVTIGKSLHPPKSGFTCSFDELSTPDLIQSFNRGLITRAVVVDKLKEGFDSNLKVNGKKIPVKRVVIKTKEKSPISLYQRAGRAFRIGGGTVHCYLPQSITLQYAFELANGAPVICATCGEEHLTVHHTPLTTADGE